MCIFQPLILIVTKYTNWALNTFSRKDRACLETMNADRIPEVTRIYKTKAHNDDPDG
jgi:hypothetical protein